MKGSRGEYVQNNFEKFLVSQEGKPIKRVGADVAPRRLEPELREMLGISAAALLNLRASANMMNEQFNCRNVAWSAPPLDGMAPRWF